MLFIKNINWVHRDKIFRNLFSINELKKLIIKSLLFNIDNDYHKKFFYDNHFKKFKKTTSISKTRNNCMFLGNSRSIIQKFKLSRYTCKKFAGMGFIIGLRKSSF